MLRAAGAAIMLALLQACAATDLDVWPDNIPPRDFFARAWQEDGEDQKLQSLETYLVWVRRFYEGWLIEPGWISRMQSLTESLDDEPRALLSARLTELGREISPEWAKDNRHRRVTTAMISRWGGVLKRSHAKQRTLIATDRILQDLRSLLAGNLRPDEISVERYADLTADPPEQR